MLLIQCPNCHHKIHIVTLTITAVVGVVVIVVVEEE
jgi:hypothetical protein